MRKPDNFSDLKLLMQNLRSQNSKEFDDYYASETQPLRVLIKNQAKNGKGIGS